VNCSRPRYRIRGFEARDANAVAALFSAYMRETYAATSAMSVDVLLRDGQGLRFSMFVAVNAADEPVGFAAWRDAYDLHHGLAGGEIPDMFIARPHRGRALSVRLAAAVAQAIRLRGGKYLKSEVLADDAKRLRLLHRVTIGFPGESVYLSGRAFRQLSELSDADPKALLRMLPLPAASREP
jgi:GNAT superfamily N-acetyltransferase